MAVRLMVCFKDIDNGNLMKWFMCRVYSELSIFVEHTKGSSDGHEHQKISGKAWGVLVRISDMIIEALLHNNVYICSNSGSFVLFHFQCSSLLVMNSVSVFHIME